MPFVKGSPKSARESWQRSGVNSAVLAEDGAKPQPKGTVKMPPPVRIPPPNTSKG